jgi:hypothetical protein
MPPPEVWGPPTWTLLHVLAEKINEEHFHALFPSLFNHIKRICSFLPCPECSHHAKQFLDKINLNDIKTKTDFKNIIYIFHNAVNKRKRKPLFNYSQIDKYKNINITNAYNSFIVVYNTNGNLKLLTESFHRKFVINDFKKWLTDNLKYFI